MPNLAAENLKVKIYERQGLPLELEMVLDVHAVGLGTDRTHIAGWVFERKKLPLFERLKRCIEAGKAFDTYEVLTDVYGHTYITAHQVEYFHRQYMNGSLKKL